MKPIIPFLSITVFLLLLAFSNVGYARKGLEDYWERKMEGQAMPEVIKDLVAQIQNQPSSSVSDSEKDRFVRDFDIRPNVILYHTHVEKKMKNTKIKMKPSVKKLEEQEDFAEEAINKG